MEAETRQVPVSGQAVVSGETQVRRVTGKALAIPDEVLREVAAPDRLIVTARLSEAGIRARVQAVATFGTAGSEASGAVDVAGDELREVESALAALAERYKVQAVGNAMQHAYKAREMAQSAPAQEGGDQ